MTTYYMTPIATILQYFSDSGVVLNGGKVSTYLAGTSTPQATKTDSTGSVDNANPIILNSAGRLPNVSIWQAQGIKLKIIITDANNNQIGQPIDQVAGIDDPTDLLATLASNSVGSGADLIANAVRSFDLISSVRAAGAPTLVAGQTRVIDIQAGTTPDDGLGGLFYWSASSTATDDGNNVIKPTSVSGAGRYLRQVISSTGSFTGTLSGMTATTTGTVFYRVYNNVVYLFLGGTIQGTSNANSMNLTGLPSSLKPSVSRIAIATALDNTGEILVRILIDSSTGTLAFQPFTNANPILATGTFTTSGTKGLYAYWNISYNL